MMNAINDYRQPYWYPSFIEPDPHYRRVRIDHTRRALSLCAELGAPTSRPSRAGRSPPARAARRRSTCSSRSSSPWPSTRHDLGVLLLIEPEPGLLLETTDQYLEVAERLNAPSIGLNFDVGHAFCVGEDLPRAIAKLAPDPPLPLRRHRGDPGPSPPRAGHRGDRLRRGHRGDPPDRLRRLADRRALSVPRRPRRRGAGRARGLEAAARAGRGGMSRWPCRSSPTCNWSACPTSSPPPPTAWQAGSWSAGRSRSPGAGCRWWSRRWRSTRRGSRSTTCSTTRSTWKNGRTGRCPRVRSRAGSRPGWVGRCWSSGRSRPR